MISPARVSAHSARLLLLDSQGLLDDPARRVTPAAVRTLVERMGFVQIDSINVVERAHHLILASRLDQYRPTILARLLERDRLLFEHWTHDASAIPVRWYPHWRHRFVRYDRRMRSNTWWRQRIGENPDALLAEVRDRIEREGPLLSADFEHDGESGGWWAWKPQKAALEHLWRTGTLAVARRVNFNKVYDLTERVLPEACALPAPEQDEHVAWACSTAIERLGAATPSELAAFWGAVALAEARAWCDRAAALGAIEPVVIESEDGGKPRRAFAVTDWRERLERAPAPPGRMRLLSPFEPVIRDRARTRRLFNFEYTFEAFVPAAKRRYGYYVMPMLERDRLVGRADLKLHRADGRLEVRGLWWEPGVKATKARRAHLEAALARLAELVGADRVSIDS
jgi:uncharacterized protein